MKTKLTSHERLCIQYNLVERYRELAKEQHGNKTHTLNEICEFYTPIITGMSDKELIQQEIAFLQYPKPLV